MSLTGRDVYLSVARLVALLLLLYIFLTGIESIGAAFKLFGRDFAESLFSQISNPMVGLMVGILATSLVQSSSTVTSIVVGLVAGAGAVGADVLTINEAIPVIMGANVGTSVTNTLVSVAQITRRTEFERAFAASTVHDIFNLLTVLVLFPLQVKTGFLSHSSGWLVQVFQDMGGLKFSSPLKVIVKPAAALLEHLAGGNPYILLAVALLLLFFSLKYLVSVLKSAVLAKVEKFFDRYLFRNAALAMFLGMCITVLVQSSSITTSLVVPLVGAGVLTLRQVYPFTLGANVGTTVTAILAALSTGSVASITVAFAHLFFNLFGIMIFWPLRALPLALAQALARNSMRSRIIPFAYIGIVFFLVPGLLIYIFR